MEKHEEFTAWAVSKGAKIHGIAAHAFPGRGLGIIATEKLEVSQSHDSHFLLQSPISQTQFSKLRKKKKESISCLGILQPPLFFIILSLLILQL